MNTASAPVPLESILRTEELNRRPIRAPDYATENRALLALTQALADAPNTILQSLAEKILEALKVGSAGVSLLTDNEERFYWPAIAGMWQAHIGGGTPRKVRQNKAYTVIRVPIGCARAAAGRCQKTRAKGKT